MPLEKLKKSIEQKSAPNNSQPDFISQKGSAASALGSAIECGNECARIKKAPKGAKKDARFAGGVADATTASGQDQKNEPPAPVTRADGTEVQEGIEKMKNLWRMEPAVRHIMRRSAALADQLTEQDVADDARVIREAANATIIAYDPHLKKHVERPDHKTRLAATTLRRAYHEGLPVKREISVQANFESGEEVIARLRQSPEAMRILGGAIDEKNL